MFPHPSRRCHLCRCRWNAGYPSLRLVSKNLVSVLWPGAQVFISTHTTVLFAIILTFVFTVYATSPKIGSISRMHELLTEISLSSPVSGNAGGSYLTMRSLNGLIFGVINLVGEFLVPINV